MIGHIEIKVLSITDDTLEFMFYFESERSSERSERSEHTTSLYMGFSNDIYTILRNPERTANLFRRILQSEIPSLAIDCVDIELNESYLNDECISLRVGFIPICTNSLESFVSKASCLCQDSNEGCSQCTIQFSLNAEASDQPQDVYSSQLISQNPSVQCMPNILITRLAVGESLKMRAFAKKYVGREHTKWSPVCGVIFNQQDNGYKFTVETIKSVPTMYILQAGASILQNNLKLGNDIKISHCVEVE